METQHTTGHRIRRNRANINRQGSPEDKGLISGGFTQIDGERFYKIANSHLMDPFFVSLVSASDHWMFIASNSALTAGRKNSGSSLFPYYSCDKLIDLVESAGTKTIFHIDNGTKSHCGSLSVRILKMETLFKTSIRTNLVRR